MPEPPNIEMERLKVERLKVYGNIVTVIITVVLGTLAVAYINWLIQQRQLLLQEKKANDELKLQQDKATSDRQQAEMKYLGEYIKYALDKDQNIRLRFSQYFAKLTISDSLQKKWSDYYTLIEETIKNEQQTSAQLRAAEEKGDEKKIEELSAKLAIQQLQLADLQTTRLIAHIQTRTGRVTPIARLVRQTLTAARQPADFEKVLKNLSSKTTNVISTHARNIEEGQRILQILQPLDLGDFEMALSPELNQNEIHVFLVKE